MKTAILADALALVVVLAVIWTFYAVAKWRFRRRVNRRPAVPLAGNKSDEWGQVKPIQILGGTVTFRPRPLNAGPLPAFCHVCGIHRDGTFLTDRFPRFRVLGGRFYNSDCSHCLRTVESATPPVPDKKPPARSEISFKTGQLPRRSGGSSPFAN